jgi:chromosome segregation ATPase
MEQDKERLKEMIEEFRDLICEKDEQIDDLRKDISILEGELNNFENESFEEAERTSKLEKGLKEIEVKLTKFYVSFIGKETLNQLSKEDLLEAWEFIKELRDFVIEVNDDE